MKKLLAALLLTAGIGFAQFSVGIHIGEPPRPRMIRVRPNAPGPAIPGSTDIGIHRGTAIPGIKVTGLARPTRVRNGWPRAMKAECTIKAIGTAVAEKWDTTTNGIATASAATIATTTMTTIMTATNHSRRTG